MVVTTPNNRKDAVHLYCVALVPSLYHHCTITAPSLCSISPQKRPTTTPSLIGTPTDTDTHTHCNPIDETFILQPRKNVERGSKP